MRSCGSTLACKSTSAILIAPGSAARTRTPTGCCASTFRRAPISACTARTILRPWRSPSTAGLARPWAGKHLPRRLTGSYDQPKQAMLRRPLESALAAAVRVMDQTGCRSADDEGTTQRSEREFLLQPVAHRPAHHATGIQVDDDRKI